MVTGIFTAHGRQGSLLAQIVLRKLEYTIVHYEDGSLHIFGYSVSQCLNSSMAGYKVIFSNSVVHLCVGVSFVP